MLLAESRLGKERTAGFAKLGFFFRRWVRETTLRNREASSCRKVSDQSFLVGFVGEQIRTTQHRSLEQQKITSSGILGETPKKSSKKHWFLQIHNCQNFSSSFGNSHVFFLWIFVCRCVCFSPWNSANLWNSVDCFPVIQLGRNKFSIGSTSFPLKKPSQQSVDQPNFRSWPSTCIFFWGGEWTCSWRPLPDYQVTTPPVPTPGVLGLGEWFGWTSSVGSHLWSGNDFASLGRFAVLNHRFGLGIAGFFGHNKLLKDVGFVHKTWRCELWCIDFFGVLLLAAGIIQMQSYLDVGMKIHR